MGLLKDLSMRQVFLIIQRSEMMRYGYLCALLLLWIVLFHVENVENAKVSTKKQINLLKKEIKKTNKKIKSVQSQNQKQKTRIAALERKVANSGDSFDAICNQVEKAGGGTVECCVDSSNNKMFCDTKTNLDILTVFNIDTSTNGVCDRGSGNTPPTINICHDDFDISGK